MFRRLKTDRGNIAAEAALMIGLVLLVAMGSFQLLGSETYNIFGIVTSCAFETELSAGVVLQRPPDETAAYLPPCPLTADEDDGDK